MRLTTLPTILVSVLLFTVPCLGQATQAFRATLSATMASAASSLGRTLSVTGGSDLAAEITAADAQLGAAPGTIVVARAGTLATKVLLGSGHNLAIRAAVQSNASIVLAGNNSITCQDASALLTSAAHVDFFQVVASPVSHITISHCNYRAAGNSGWLLNALTSSPGKGGGTVSYVDMNHNYVSGLGLYDSAASPATAPSVHLSFNDNTVENFYVAIYLHLATQNVTGNGNRFNNGANAIDPAGTDGAKFPTYVQIRAVGNGDMTFNNNTCTNVTACIFSDGSYGIVMSHNDAIGCADTCYDLEGTVDSKILNNHCLHNKGNFCASQFFSSYNNEISGNTFESNIGGFLIMSKNSSANPGNSQNLMVDNNHLLCAKVMCIGVGLEPDSGTTIRKNSFTNAIIYNIMSPGLTVDSNTLTYSLPLGKDGAGLSVATSLNGRPLMVENNVIKSLVAQPPSVTCIRSGSTDSNNSDTYTISGNTCVAWPAFLALANNNPNLGVTAVWNVHNNTFLGSSGSMPPVTTVGGASHNTALSKSGNCSATAPAARKFCD